MFAWVIVSVMGLLFQQAAWAERNEVVISQPYISAEVGREIDLRVRAAPNATIVLRNIRGGSGGGLMASIFAVDGRVVEVQGRCMSACALLAIQSRSITLSDGHAEPSMLFFHAMYTGSGREKFRQVKVNAAFSKLINARFPFLGLSAVERMMSYDDIDSGLRVRKKAEGVYVFEDCNPIPNCSVLAEYPLLFL